MSLKQSLLTCPTADVNIAMKHDCDDESQLPNDKGRLIFSAQTVFVKGCLMFVCSNLLIKSIRQLQREQGKQGKVLDKLRPALL